MVDRDVAHIGAYLASRVVSFGRCELSGLLFFENGLYYLKVKYYTRPLHSDDAHS
jgi:hypothetical protein